MEDQIIECPECQWIPDGEIYWRCECEHSWNTFETKGKCPNCHKQWADTYCPGCGKTSTHDHWYVSSAQKISKEREVNPVLLKRKKIVEERLVKHGILNRRISYLPYIEFDEKDFQEPNEVGCRLLVLWSVYYLTFNMDRKDNVKQWLDKNELWDKVSPNEKLLFTQNQTEQVLEQLSWRIEAVIVLGWSLNLIDNLPPLNTVISDEEFDKLQEKLPIGKDVKQFLINLEFRDKEEIYVENIINEMATSYFRDMMLSDQIDESDIDKDISMERHQTLNWVRQFGGISEWDNTDTST